MAKSSKIGVAIGLATFAYCVSPGRAFPVVQSHLELNLSLKTHDLREIPREQPRLDFQLSRSFPGGTGCPGHLFSMAKRIYVTVYPLSLRKELL